MRASASVVTIEPGDVAVVLEDSGAAAGPGRPALAIVASQEESLDDGGSQSGLGILTVHGTPPTRVELDVRDGAVLTVPASRFTVSVRNLNESGQPSLKVSAFYLASRGIAENTRTFDIGHGMDNPNIRVPALATAFVFDLALPDPPGYSAALSDSATGETYGLAEPRVRYPLNHRVRFVRFVDLPEGTMGTVTFFLAI